MELVRIFLTGDLKHKTERFTKDLFLMKANSANISEEFCFLN